MLHWLAAVALAGSAFYPGSGPSTVAVGADGRVAGMARTGFVLARADDPAALAALPQVAGIRRLRGHVVRITPAPGVDDVDLANLLHDRPDVRWAHPDLWVELRGAALPDDPYLGAQWHLQNSGQLGYTPGVDIGASDAWEITRGAGQLVAILDSGTDIDHPDLRVIDGHDYLSDDDSSDAVDDAHGTACAGLAVGIGDNGIGTAGVAWEADAYAIRIVGGALSLTEMYDGLTEGVDAGATVLSNSWGYEDGCAGVYGYGVFEDAFEYAEEEGRGGLGTAVVFAAGNGNCDVEANQMLADERVITVAAVSGFDVRESYSSYGRHVDIAAPSGNMSTTDILGGGGYNGYPGDDDYTSYFNGTSASTPVVSGVVALMFASNARLTAAQARDALCDTAVRVDLENGAYDADGRSPYYGCGRVDAAAAVRAVADLGPPEIPTSLLGDELHPDAAVLAWTATDPDGDPLEYDVRWAPTNDPWPRPTLHVDRPWLDLVGQVADGDEILWQVRAYDAWGETEWSEEFVTRFVAPKVATVVETEVPGGCATSSSAGGWLLAAAALSSARRDRPRTSRRCP